MLGTPKAPSLWKHDPARVVTRYRPQSPHNHSFHRLMAIAAATGTIALSLIAPALADPFRSSNPRNIDAQTENAFRAIFREGNYPTATQLLRSPTAGEPLAFAMKASLSYLNGDIPAMGENATRTREVAEQLVATDPLRGHLYTAVGHFLEGAYTFSTQGTRGTPTVLRKLQQVFENMRQAEAIDPNDPELNLLRGYMDLILAVNLPFSNPQQAIDRLQTRAAPTYLAQRGIAIGYRDLNRQDEALAAVDRALRETPTNPDVLYLKAQILARRSQYRQSLQFFQQALAKQAQLPRNMVIQIAYEECRASNQVTQAAHRRRSCDAERDASRQNQAPIAVPTLRRP